MALDKRKLHPKMYTVFEDLFHEMDLIKRDVKWLIEDTRWRRKVYVLLCGAVFSDVGVAIWKMLHP